MAKLDRIASPAEAAALIAAAPDDERAMWATAFYAGLRRGQLRALRWSRVDLDARVIHVSRGWDAIEGEQDTKTAADKREGPIIDPLEAALIAHKSRTGQRQRARIRPDGDRPVQPGNGAPERAGSMGMARSAEPRVPQMRGRRCSTSRRARTR